MTTAQATARLRKLEAMTVERGATPAEAAIAATRAERLICRFGLHGRAPGPDPCSPAWAPGVHVMIVCRRAFSGVT